MTQTIRPITIEEIEQILDTMIKNNINSGHVGVDKKGYICFFDREIPDNLNLLTEKQVKKIVGEYIKYKIIIDNLTEQSEEIGLNFARFNLNINKYLIDKMSYIIAFNDDEFEIYINSRAQLDDKRYTYDCNLVTCNKNTYISYYNANSAEVITIKPR